MTRACRLSCRWMLGLAGMLPSFAFAAPDLPPVGRSLFDELTTQERHGRYEQQVPFPFARLLRQLQAQTAPDELGRTGVPAVLIPLGRSLQRNATAEPFAHPRVVAVVTGEAAASGARRMPRLKDQLFLGYQESAAVLEVISYNEAAARYEFQVVKDYRPGGTPRVFQAKRSICTACHHAEAPIFSRPTWSETNANPSVRAMLRDHGERFYGVPVSGGVDVPNAIDDAVVRANRQLLAQTAWSALCDASGDARRRCRAAALQAAIALRLAPDAQVDFASPSGGAVYAQLSRAWSARWPDGLPEPEPNIPNRDPFFGQAQQIDRADAPRIVEDAAEVKPAFDPLVLRPPAARWHGDATGIEHFVRALADLLDARDIAALRRTHGATTDAAALLAESIARLAAAGGLDAPVFRARIVMTELLSGAGIHPSAAAPPDWTRFPAARLDVDDESGRRIAAAHRPFFRQCARCHDTRESSPPGFLRGDSAQVDANLIRCAPRIRFRLAMWNLPPTERAKVPMPPPIVAAHWEQDPPLEDLAHMRATLARLSGVSSEAPLPLRYESLPPCRRDAAMP